MTWFLYLVGMTAPLVGVAITAWYLFKDVFPSRFMQWLILFFLFAGPVGIVFAWLSS